MPVENFLRMQEGSVDSHVIDIEYDAQDRITKIFVMFVEKSRVTAWDADGIQKWSVIIKAGTHEYNIPPGQLKRHQDFASLRIEPL